MTNSTSLQNLRLSNKQQWTTKYKYKLIKAINAKYHLILSHNQNRTQKRFKDPGSSLNPPSVTLASNNKKHDKAVNTDPDILEMLELLKSYYSQPIHKVIYPP